MFGKRRKSQGPGGSEVCPSLRQQILHLDPAEAGLSRDAGTGDPWGFLLETGYPDVVATLVCLRDGTTSLYTDSGFGIIGGGGHESVVAANRRLFAELEGAVAGMLPTSDESLPETGMSVLRALTFDGHRAHRAQEADLGEGRDALAPVFRAAHDVITELRLIDEARADT